MGTSTRDLGAYLEQNDFKYAQRSDDADRVMLGFTTRWASPSLLFRCDAHPVQLMPPADSPPARALDALMDGSWHRACSSRHLVRPARSNRLKAGSRRRWSSGVHGRWTTNRRSPGGGGTDAETDEHTST